MRVPDATYVEIIDNREYVVDAYQNIGHTSRLYSIVEYPEDLP